MIGSSDPVVNFLLKNDHCPFLPKRKKRTGKETEVTNDPVPHKKIIVTLQVRS